MAGTIIEKEFVNLRVDLEGRNFYRCRFINCELAYQGAKGGEPPDFTDCTFENSTLHIFGLARHIMNFAVEMNLGPTYLALRESCPIHWTSPTKKPYKPTSEVSTS